MVVLSVGCLTLPLWAQPHREGVQQKLQSLSVEQKIDLLCARYPGVPQEGLAKYDWWSECLHGVARAGKATVFPKPIGMGSTWDAELIHRIGIAIGDEARAKHHQDVREHGYSDRHMDLPSFLLLLTLRAIRVGGVLLNVSVKTRCLHRIWVSHLLKVCRVMIPTI